MKTSLLSLGLFVLSFAFSSCNTVQYTERAYLADFVMLPENDPLASAMTEHLYFSREAAYGGQGVGGGGCGCN